MLPRCRAAPTPLTLHPPGSILTVPVGHAVKKHPVLVLGAVFNEGDVVTGLDAEHGEELHLLPGDPLASLGAPALKLLRDVQPGGFVGSAAVVGVNLREDNGVAALRGQVRARPPVYPPLDPTWPAAGAARGTWAFFGGLTCCGVTTADVTSAQRAQIPVWSRCCRTASGP